MADDKSTELPYQDAIWTYALDLERITLQERLVNANDYKPGRYQQPVVYFHVLGGELMYVGQTVDADARRVQHQKDGRDWDEEWLLVIPDYWPSAHRKSWMVCIEEAMIERLSPPYNYRRVGSACILYPAVMSHIANRGFALPLSLIHI